MKGYTLRVIQTAVYLMLLASTLPLAHADFTVAFHNKDLAATNGNFSDDASGVCLVSPVTGVTTTVVFAARIQTGTPTGTMFARVYAATGDPTLSGSSGDCAGQQLLATSNTLDANLLTGSHQNFTFIFTQRATMRAGHAYIVVIVFSVTGGTTGTQTSVGAASPALDKQHYVFSPDGGTTWNTGQPRCEAAIPSNGVCETYTLSGISPEEAAPPPGPSPYGYNPPYFPCCTQVGPTALQGASLRAPNVDSLPFIYLFLILFMLTLGPYLIVGKRRKSRQYEIAL